jgi:uncharacterized protein (TIGR02145 family)
MWGSDQCVKHIVEMKKKGALIPCLIFLGITLSCTNRSDNVHHREILAPEPATPKSGKEIVSNGQKAEDESEQTVLDIDGNQYKTVRIGIQTWMAQNLKTTRYSDGTAIPLVTDENAWAALTYGALYNGYAIMTDKLCPEGWHVPSNAEWGTLVDYLGGEGMAGNRLKEVGANYWVGPNTLATNESGFTALPGGFRYQDGLFHDFGFGGYWWTSTEQTASRLYFRHLYYEDFKVFTFPNLKKNGFSVRCLRDY